MHREGYRKNLTGFLRRESILPNCRAPGKLPEGYCPGKGRWKRGGIGHVEMKGTVLREPERKSGSSC